MKNIVIILLICCLKVNSQNKFKLDTDYFLLGMFDDYGGRYIPLKNDKFATYIANVRPELANLFLDTLSQRFKIPKNEIIREDNAFYNKKIAKYFNAFHKSAIDKDLGYQDKNGKDYEYYRLTIDESKIDTYYKKMSFLTGMFYQCGSMIDDEVVLKTANSPAFSVAIHIISELDFGYCENEKCYYCVPTKQTVTFKPSEEYLEYFKNLELKRKNGW